MNEFVRSSLAAVFFLAPVAVLVSFLLLTRYRARLIALMEANAGSTEHAVGSQTDRVEQPPQDFTAPSLALMRAAARRDLMAHCVGVIAYATVLTVTSRTMPNAGEVNVVQVAALFSGFAFPIVIVAARLRGRGRAATTVAVVYAFVVIAVSIFAWCRGNALATPLIVVFSFNVFPACAILGTFVGRTGQIGPMVYALLALALLGPNIAAICLELNLAAVTEVAAPLGFGAPGVIAVTVGLGLLVALCVGAGVLRLVKHLYVRKRINDRTLAAGSVIVVHALGHGLMLSYDDVSRAALGAFGALLGYFVVVDLLQRMREVAPQRGPTVLFLRVFRATGRRTLFTRWSGDWRYVGCVRMIAGPDLATTTIEPHEFLDFVFGRLSNHFIAGSNDLWSSLQAEDRRPDPDGRYRVTDWFCRANTWQMAFRKLAATSDVIAMDLRGFGNQHKGAKLELETVVATVDPQRIVLIVDVHTDRALVDDILGEYGTSICRVDDRGGAEPILDALCKASAPS